MGDYTPVTWSTGDDLTAAQATALSAEADETETQVAALSTQLVYAEISTALSVTTSVADLAGLSISVPLLAKPIQVEAMLGNLLNNAGGWHEFILTNPSGTNMQSVACSTVASALPNVPIPLLRYVIPASTAAGTWKIRAVAANSGGMMNQQPSTAGFTNKAFIRASY